MSESERRLLAAKLAELRRRVQSLRAMTPMLVERVDHDLQSWDRIEGRLVIRLPDDAMLMGAA